MGLNFFVPFSGTKHGVKDYVITILSYNWPLSVKKIYNLIKKKYSLNITYQAVYKTVHELIKMRILVRAGERNYKLNLKWLKDLHSYTELTETNYYTKKRHNLVMGILDAKEEGSMSLLVFETFFDVEKYLYYLQKNFVLNNNDKSVICIHHNHEWRPLFYLRAEYNWVRKIQELGGETYVLCAGRTPLDKWCAKFYKSIGLKIKTGVNCAGLSEIMVFGNLVIQIFLPSMIKNKLHEYAVKSGSIEELKLSSLAMDVFEKKAEIKVVINKDSKLAKQIRKETMSHFKQS